MDDPEQAAAAVASGDAVVLIVDPDTAPIPGWPDGPGRMALFLGRPDDPEVRAAAASMAAELFGSSGQ